MSALKPDVVEWLTEQCSRLKNGRCSTLGCLRRGGYVGPPASYDIATCEAYEIFEVVAKGISDERNKDQRFGPTRKVHPR